MKILKTPSFTRGKYHILGYFLDVNLGIAHSISGFD